jgi:hypothetical protein
VVRRYEEPIEVRATADETAGGAPDAFLWRGRLYIVREVLDHWKERRPWWRDAFDDRREPGTGAPAGSPATASTRTPSVRPSTSPAVSPVMSPAVSRAGAPAAATPTATPPPDVPDVLGGARERQVWRVEASPGRMAGTGVYDLCADLSPRQWRLLRVAD